MSALAEAFDPALIPELQGSRLGQRVAALLGRGETAAVPELVRGVRPGPDGDAIARLRGIVTDRAERASDALEGLMLAEALAALSPDQAEPLIALCHAARRAEDEERIETALTTLAARFPEAPAFRRLARKFASDLAKEVQGGGVRVARLACRAAASGVLDPSLHAPVVAAFRAQRVPATRLARLLELCPAIADGPAVRAEAEDWHQAALALAPPNALQELARLAPLLPLDRVLADMVRISFEIPRAPHPALLALLRTGARGLPPDLRRRAERRWRQLLTAKWDQGDSERADACFQALEALGVVKPSDLAQAVMVIDELDDPEDRLPALLERCQAAGVTDLPQLPAWQSALRDALRRRSAPDIWRFGRRLLAIGQATPEAMDALLNAAGRITVAPEALFAVAEAVAAAGHVPGRTLLATTRRDIVATALTMLVPGTLDRALSVLGWAIDHAELRATALGPVGQKLADGAAQELPAALARLAVRHPAAAGFLGGLAALHVGAQAEAAEQFEKALAAGLSGELGELATRESLAATFTLVSPVERAGEPALVLIEGRANETLISRAGALAPSLQVCAAEFVGAEMGEGNVTGELEFRFSDLPIVSDAVDAFTEWAMRALEQKGQQFGPGPVIARRHREYVRRHLAYRLFGKLRVAYTFSQAVAATGLRRAFFITNTTHAARVVARDLLEEGGYEVRVACGMPAPAGRRSFVPEAVAAPLEQRDVAAAKAIDPRRQDLASLPQFTSADVATGGRKTLLFIITAARADVMAPVPDLIAAALAEWAPVIVFIDTNGTADQMRNALARDPRPGMSSVPFHAVRTADLIAEAKRQHDPSPIQRAIAAIDPAASRMRRAGLLLGTDIVDPFHDIESAAALAEAMDHWARRTARRLAPEAVVFTHAAILETNTVCAAFAGAGVPTIWLQLLQHAREKRFKRPPADHHLLLDRYSADLWHEFLGVPREDCTVVGSLRISAVLNRARTAAPEEARAELGLAPTDKLVLIATQPVATGENLVLIENVLAAIGDAPGIRILVKLHPAESEERIGAYARAFAGTAFETTVEVSKTRDIYRSILASELVVIQHSNVGIEALMMDRAALAIVVGEKIATFSIGAHGVEEAQAGPEAAARIRALLIDPVARAEADAQRRALLDADPEMHDGRVPERIVERIRMIIDSRGKGA